MIITAAPELLHLSPNDIDIDINVRLDPRLDREFLSSIEEHGVLVPVLAVRFDGQCKPRVREGQRRIQAARQVGLASVPVYIRTVEGTDADLRAQRIIEQIVTNDQRAPLTAAERARGIHQLLLEGVSPTKVAKGLSTTKTTVAAAQAAIDSERAMSALDTGQLSLIEAASFVEFDGDDDAQAALIKVAGTDQFDHRVAQLRADREDRRRRQEAAAPFAAQGYTVLDRRPSWSDTDHVDTNYLRDATGAALTDEAIAAMDPRHWAVVLVDTESFRDAETGEPVDERDIDFDTADDPTLEPADGLRHARTITQTTEWVPDYYCTNPIAAGVTLTSYGAQRYGVDVDRLADAADPDGAAARERAREEAAEAERAERRKLIALNKLGEAAATVRRAWVRDTLLIRKSAPAGAALYLAEALATRPDLFSDYHGQRIAQELLGLAAGDTLKTAVAKLPPTADGRALVILLGAVFATTEARTGKDAWRAPQDIAQNYLRFLEANGYPLSDIERVILGATTADAVYRKVCAE